MQDCGSKEIYGDQIYVRYQIDVFCMSLSDSLK